MEKYGYKFYLEAELQPVKETVALRKEAASVISLPDVADRQPDLSYFSSIFVSTGTNLNNAHFLASELVMAEGTVAGKAVDIEHEEDQIIGHIYANAFTDKNGKGISLEDLKNREIASLDDEELHVEIASVIYKTRFPEVAQEVSEGKWKVSMEAYYMDYDVKIGDTILSKDEAAALGFSVADETSYGKHAQIVKAGEVIDEGVVAKVLRGICFSGVGIVKNPANPPSVVLEATASSEDTIVLDYDNASNSGTNNVTSLNTEDVTNNVTEEQAELQYNDTVGVCVNYHKELHDTVIEDQDAKVIATNWCSKYDSGCPAAGDATSDDCLRVRVINDTVRLVEAKLDSVNKTKKIETLTDNLMLVLKNRENK